MTRKHSVWPLVLALAVFAAINLRVGATSIVPFFSDEACQDSIFTGRTDQQAFNGTCQAVPSEANSVDPSHLDLCCAGDYQSARIRCKSMTLTKVNSHGLHRPVLLRQWDTCSKRTMHISCQHWLVQRRLSLSPVYKPTE